MCVKEFSFVVFIVVMQTLLLNVNGGKERSVPLFNIMDSEISEGKKHYQMITTQLPRYGKCWKKAVEDLHEGCNHLTEDLQSRLALSFANCFLLKLGLKTYPCSHDESVALCLRNIDNKAFTTYTEFFTHTQSICFYLQSQSWQEQTENTIFKLTDSSIKVSQQLEESSSVQSEVLKLQQLSLDKQEHLMKNGETLNLELEKSRLNLRILFNEFKITTSEQRKLVHEVFERVTKMQYFVLGEFSGFYTLIFYVSSTIVCYLLTSTTRTRDARFWVFIILSLNFAIERVITTYNIEEESTKPGPLDPSVPVYQCLWLCRKISCSLVVLALLWFAYRHKDYNFINNKLLLEIHHQTAELKCFLYTMEGRHTNIVPTKHANNEFVLNKPYPGVVDSCYDSDSSDDRTFHYCSSEESDLRGSFSSNVDEAERTHKNVPTEYKNGSQMMEKDVPISKQGNSWLVSSLNRSSSTTNHTETKLVEECNLSTKRYNLRARTPITTKKHSKNYS